MGLMDKPEDLALVRDPLDRFRMASSAIDRKRVEMSRLATIRAQALLELRSTGRSAIELAELIGVTRQQIHRLLREATGENYTPVD